MKKILPYILMLLVLVNLFAPLSVGIGQDQVTVQKNVAQADGKIALTITPSATDTAITVNVKVTFGDTQVGISQGVQVSLSGGTVTTPQVQTVNNLTDDGTGTNTETGTVVFNGLSPSTSYAITATGREVSHLGTAWNFTTIWGVDPTSLAEGIANGSMAQTVINPQIVPTNAAGQKTPASAPSVSSATPDSFMPLCGLNDTGPLSVLSKGTIAGCAEQFSYYVIFVPTSFIFALAGEFFDSTFAFSVNDTSYRSTFVVQGWGLIRDFCNMFFIFVLLYIAFATILNIHGFKTKEMIINVIIIGLFLNFSLFATQMIIDTSNILARVFYNSNAIMITAAPNAANGVTNTASGAVNPDGSLPLSAAIVNKVNPQNLIINGRQSVVVTDSVSGQPSTTSTALSTGTLILITLLAVAVNVVGIFVFISVGLIFVARIIGLWLAMILAPLAFFSYTIPSMQDIDMIGWRKWWPETIKLAFLAPIFIFFIYLILQFLNAGLGLYQASSATGISFVLGIMIPFIFIMVLLLQAKKIAQKMSGTLGSSITGGIAAAAGLALGGAALGTAVLGRNIIGKGVAAASRTDDSMHYGKQKVAFNKNLEDWDKNGKIGPKPTWEDHKAANGVKDNLMTRIGGNLNAKQMQVNEVDHARHEIDAMKDKAGLKDVQDSKLSGVNEQKIKETYAKEKRSIVEADIRKNGSTDLKGQPDGVLANEDAYKSANRKGLVTSMKADPANIALDKKGKPTGELTDEAKKKVENELNVQFNGLLKQQTDIKLSHQYDHLKDESRQHVSGIDRVMAQSNRGTYDVRNLSQTKKDTDKREHITTRLGAAGIAGIAMAVRTGLKSHDVNHGSGQGEFFADLKHTVSEAMKSTKINVKVEESHGHSAADNSHSAGGGHH